MPPRHHYWTIILEGKPTAFRAHTQEELAPTLRQLQARHPDAVVKWFARGRLWESQDAERAEALASRRAPAAREKRPRDWRPGGEHKDPRERFKIPRDEKRRRFAENLRRDERTHGTDTPPREGPPREERPQERAPREDRRPVFGRPPRGDRPAVFGRPAGPRVHGGRPPGTARGPGGSGHPPAGSGRGPGSRPPGGARPFGNRPSGARPHGGRPPGGRPPGARPPGARKPGGGSGKGGGGNRGGGGGRGR